MKQYQAVISSKGQLVIPKDLRDRFRLVTGSRLNITVEDERIVLHPRSIGDEMEEFIAVKLKEKGQPVNKKNISQYKQLVNQVFDRIIAKMEAEYENGDAVTLKDLKQELGNG